MEELLRIKFRNQELRAKLIATGDTPLAEGNLHHDRFFGICHCKEHGGVGENWLGKLLMKIRGELQAGMKEKK